MITWEENKKPSFFLVGAAKSGTTSVCAYLESHTELYLSPVKEPNYFGSDILPELFSKSYRKSLDVFDTASPLEKKQIAFIRNGSEYQSLFSGNQHALKAGECSTSYLFSSAAAEELKRFNPEAKILIILRNPLERAYSHYLMAVQMGLESRDFLEAFKNDREEKEKGWGISQLYYELGSYPDQVKRYLDHFGEEQVKVMLFEDWTGQLKETQESICKFLNVSIFAGLENEVLNKSVSPKNPKLHAMLMKFGIKDLAKKMLPKKIFENFKKQQYKAENSVLATHERAYLKQVYQEEILELEKLIKRDLSNWLK